MVSVESRLSLSTIIAYFEGFDSSEIYQGRAILVIPSGSDSSVQVDLPLLGSRDEIYLR